MIARRHRSRRVGSAPLWLVAVVALALPATADAPKTQYGQYTSETPEIQDLKTTLVWDRFRVVKQASPPVGETYCASIVVPNGRVPTIKELLTLVDEEPYAEYNSAFKPPFVQKNVDGQAFAKQNGPVDKPYWSSTPGPNPGEFWTIDFQTGITAIKTTADPLYVRCVR